MSGTALLNEDEARVMALINEAGAAIVAWGLSRNSTELSQALHTLQGFVVRHMLCRLEPDAWSDWWRQDPAPTTGEPT